MNFWRWWIKNIKVCCCMAEIVAWLPSTKWRMSLVRGTDSTFVHYSTSHIKWRSLMAHVMVWISTAGSFLPWHMCVCREYLIIVGSIPNGAGTMVLWLCSFLCDGLDLRGPQFPSPPSWAEIRRRSQSHIRSMLKRGYNGSCSKSCKIPMGGISGFLGSNEKVCGTFRLLCCKIPLPFGL